MMKRARVVRSPIGTDGWMAVAAAVLVTALSSPTPVRAQTSYGPLSLQIVAHQDDDFLFMNPDLGNAIASGYPIVTVYLTAGQSVGTSEGITPALDREHFAAARQRGIRAAYAQMAGLPDSWSRSILLPDGIHQVERYVLSGTAQPIHLLFMNLPDGGDTLEPHANALADMWGNAGYVTDTIVPACAFPQPCYFVPVAPMFYDRAGVLAVLRALIDEYQPVHVRSLDPQPFENMPIVSYDNTDHTAAARFASLALAGYHGPYASRRYSLVAYKGYSFLNYPRSLGFADASEKSSTAATYQPFDPNYDYYQTYHGSYEGYYHVMWERYPGSSTWLERSADGRLVAATVEDRRVQLWHEWIPGSGDWGGPILLPGTTPVSPHLTLLRRGDGRLQVFAMRLPLEREVWGPSPALPLQEIVTAVEIPTVSPAPIRFGPWSVVGSPDAADCAFAACQFAGPQTAAIDGAGRTYVFAKRSDGRIAYTYSSSGGPWAAWNWFGLEDIVDGIAAMTRDDGRIELFATSRSGEIQHLI